MTTQFQNIIISREPGGVRWLTVNRPKQLNALSRETLQEIKSALAEIAEDAESRVLLLTGAGDKAFIAGADISQFSGLSALDAREMGQLGQEVAYRLEQLDIPAIAVVNGFALGGGCELAMACDWIIASEHAKFGQPEINLGLIPGFGGTQRLMRMVGKAMATELCMTGRMLDAEEARRIGLVNRVHSAGDLIDEATELAVTLSEKAPVALKFIKQALRDGQNMSLEHGCTLEVGLFGLCFTTEDKEEGVSAFLEKRAARFKGA